MSNQKNVWFTSDLHFLHERVAVEHRGFGNSAAHDALVSRIWRKRVKPEDTVIIVGDISSGTTRGQNGALEIIDDLPGDKLIVLGNHDGPHPRNGTRSIAWEKRYRETFGLGVRIKHRFNYEGIKFIACHYPFLEDHTDPPRDLLWRFPVIPNDDHILLHGHTHQKHKITSDNEISVGLDAWSFSPVMIGEIARTYLDFIASKSKQVERS